MEDREIEIKNILCCVKGEEPGEQHCKDMKALGTELKNDKTINNLSEFFSALGNKDRLIILNVLKDGELCVCELELVLNKSQPSISHHLRTLERVGLIRGYKKGKFTYYEILEDNLKNYIESMKETIF